jgi:hypothetical protein
MVHPSLRTSSSVAAPLALRIVAVDLAVDGVPRVLVDAVWLVSGGPRCD